MIAIKKGDKRLRVTRAAFLNFYKSAGWSEVAEKVKRQRETQNNDAHIKDEWDEWGDDEVEKPVSEMNKQELEEYASAHGIDLTGLNSEKAYRKAINSFIGGE